MLAKGHETPVRLSRRIKAAFTHVEALGLTADAKACGMTQAKFIRALVLSGRGDTTHKPKRKRNRDADKLADEIHLLAMQVKKLGTNVNQMAKQANAGMVAIGRAEVQYLLNQHQQLMSLAIAYLERANAP